MTAADVRPWMEGQPTRDPECGHPVPPAGKVWVTFETTRACWDDPYAIDPKALTGDSPVRVQYGPDA